MDLVVAKQAKNLGAWSNREESSEQHDRHIAAIFSSHSSSNGSLWNRTTAITKRSRSFMV